METTVLTCLRLCNDFPDLDGILIKEGNVEVRVLEPTDKRKTGYIVFRGVDETADLIQSANYLYSSVSPGNVHTGFYEQASKIASSLLSALDNSGTYIVTGYSLGAALATICMPFIDWCAEEVHLFASPRVFDPSAALMFDMVYRSMVHRWYHPMDVICHYPFFGYRHIGTPHNILGDGRSWDAISELFPYHPCFPLLNGLTTVVQALLYPMMDDYHSLEVYRSHLGG